MNENTYPKDFVDDLVNTAYKELELIQMECLGVLKNNPENVDAIERIIVNKVNDNVLAVLDRIV